jgi:hypothetical protein
VSVLIVLVAGLGLPGLLPALILARRSPAIIFLAPLIGAAMAAVATEFELKAAGSLVLWYVVVVLVVNAASVAWWLARGRQRDANPPAPEWVLLTAVAAGAALVVPLVGLRAQLLGVDSEQIWLTHAMMISGGHRELLSSLTNHSYWPGNPDYPPLVPAAGALAFAFYGLGNLHIAADVTVLLNACAVGVVAVGIATVVSTGRVIVRVGGVVAGCAICVVAFAISGAAGVNGYADLLWAAAAAGSVVWGLVLPRSPRALTIAWVCAVVASLTKDEGLTTSLAVLGLIALRYLFAGLPVLGRASEASDGTGTLARWIRYAVRFAVLVIVPALPGLAWVALMRSIGLHDRFFNGSARGEPPSARVSPTIHGLAAHLVVAPVAAAALLVGCLIFGRERKRAGLGNPAWLWLACLASLLVTFYTYVFGALVIKNWLVASDYRTTIFAQLLLYTELALWMVIALDRTFPVTLGRAAVVELPRPEPAARSQRSQT